MRRGWRAVVGAVVLAVAAVVSEGSLPVAHAQPALVAAKDFSKPAIVVLGYGLNDNGTMRKMLMLLGFPDGNPSQNIAQLVRDVMSPHLNIG